MSMDFSFTVRTYHVDQNSRLRSPALMGYLQEAAWYHAAALQVSVHDLRGKGLAWFLSRLTISMDYWPALGDKLTVTTWPSGGDKLYQYRDFEVKDARGRVIGRAGSSWLVVALENRKLSPLPAFIKELPAQEPTGVLATSKLRWPGEATHRRQLSVRWHDHDQYGHVNNTIYAQWALESLPWTQLSSQTLTYLDVQFRQEAQGEGNILSESAEREAGNYLHQVTHEAHGQVLAMLETRWQGGEG